MIEEYTLKKLCDKYGINSSNIVNKNNNILTYGEFFEIDKVLNYLVNELKISSINIEKCPSILYRNVNAIKKNVEFLEQVNVNFSDIETCLHVLSTDPVQLIETYEYVKDNYGIGIINKTTSILSVPKEIIIDVENLNLSFKNKKDNLTVAIGIEFGDTNLKEIIKIIHSEEFKQYPHLFTSTVLAQAKLEEIVKIIHSEEFKQYPHLFTSTVLAQAKLEEIVKIIHSEEFRKYPHLFTSQVLAKAKLEDIVKIIQSEEFKNYPHLFTSEVLAHTKLEDIVKIIQSEEFKNYPHLFTSTVLAKAKLEDIVKIIQSEEFQKYPHLFTSTVLAQAKLEDISKLLTLPYWQDDRFKNLLTSTILSNSKTMISKIPILIKLAEDYSIDKYLNTSYFLLSPSQNYALIRYIIDNGLPLVISGKLNSIFGYQPLRLKQRYGIDIKELMKKYPFETEKYDVAGGKKK